MKHINRFILFLMACSIITACTINDPVDDVINVGKFGPTAYWEIKSTEITAGDSIYFKLQYYPNDGKTISGFEAWYTTYCKTEKSVTCPLIRTTTVRRASDTTELVRAFQGIASYPHLETYWTDSTLTYLVNSGIPTSYTLNSESMPDNVFDKNAFEKNFGIGYLENFQDEIYSKAEVSDLNTILTTTFSRVSEERFRIYIDTLPLDPVTGKIPYTIKKEYQDTVRNLFYSIPADSLLYDGSTKSFKIIYKKSYSVDAQIKVIDNENISTMTEVKTIKLN
ncbi:MAG: hypothetical protein ACLVKO_07855 [Dysgonomonas sp.]